MSDRGAMLLSMTTARGCSADNIGTNVSQDSLYQSLRHEKPMHMVASETRSQKKPELSKSDVAAAMAWGKPPRGVTALAYVKYCGFNDSLSDLEIALLLASTREVNARRLKIPSGSELIRNHARLAIRDAVGSNRCTVCNGTGYQWQKPCQTCNGTGVVRITKQQLAEMAGICRKSWYNNWKPVYDFMVSELAHWDQRAIDHVSRYCSEGKINSD